MNIFRRFTMRTLLANRTRTLVTIIGIALSVSMFTAVTSTIVSFQEYLVNVEIHQEGAWEGWMEYTSKEDVTAIGKDSRVSDTTVISDIGYALLDKSSNEDKPYLYIAGIQSNFTDFSPIHLQEGRMPKGDNELVIPAHLAQNGGVSYKVGDQLELQVGQRMSYDATEDATEDITSREVTPENSIGGQCVSYQGEDKETLGSVIGRTYTVVGICERPSFEEYSAPGYTAFTLYDGTVSGAQETAAYDTLLKFHNPMQSEKTLVKYSTDGSFSTHNDLLRYMGKSLDRSFNAVIYSMGAILMVIIMIGSISLIYNAFSISVSERTKQFGLLKSIGATKRQMRHSVLFETCLLSLVGIPLGLLAGLGGIGVTLHFIGRLFSYMWNEASRASGLQMTLAVTWYSIGIAAGIGFITVLISSMIPAHRAVRVSPMQAIRQSADLRIKGKDVKTSGLTYRLFGFEAMIASKNFKRNRRKYRTTVFSLFISIVLFVSATSFSSYMKKSLSVVSSHSNGDISFCLDDAEMKDKTVNEVINDVETIDKVDACTYSRSVHTTLYMPSSLFNPEYLDKVQQYMPDIVDEADKTVSQPAVITYVSDASYKKYLEEHKLDVSQYMDTEKRNALVWDNATVIVDGKVYQLNILDNGKWSGDANLVTVKSGYYVNEVTKEEVIYQSEEDGETEKRVPLSKASVTQKLNFASIQSEQMMPLGVSDQTWNCTLSVVLPYSAAPQTADGQRIDGMGEVDFSVLAKDHSAAYNKLSQYLIAQNLDGSGAGSLYDSAASAESQRALITIVDIFSYGFIVLISLISVANVFNTISTNIRLRRQDFAMLKSVGMTQKGFDRMMNYECLLYGGKGLIYGIPVSILLSFFMYRAVGEGMNARYIFPWQGILIASVCAFMVVFATMLYSMKKVKKDNPIEALRNENL